MGDATTTEKRPGLPRWIPCLAGAVLLIGGLFYAFLAWYSQYDAIWGAMGDAIAPFTALFNAGALFAALWAVHLQRQESHDAGENTKAQLSKMGEQLAEFAKSAKAQQALANAQQELASEQRIANLQHQQEIELQRRAIAVEKELVEAQREANRMAEAAAFLALRAEHARRSGSIAVLVSGLASARAAIETAAVTSPNGGQVETKLRTEVTNLEARWMIEQTELKSVAEMINEAEKERKAAAAERERKRSSEVDGSANA